jgi:hypothetical protein
VNLTKASAQSSFNWSTGVVSMTDPKALDSTIAACGGGSGAIFVGANAQYCYAAGNPNVNVGNSGGFSFGLGAGGGPSATRFEYQGSYAHFLDAVRKKDRID